MRNAYDASLEAIAPHGGVLVDCFADADQLLLQALRGDGHSPSFPVGYQGPRDAHPRRAASRGVHPADILITAMRPVAVA